MFFHIPTDKFPNGKATRSLFWDAGWNYVGLEHWSCPLLTLAFPLHGLRISPLQPAASVVLAKCEANRAVNESVTSNFIMTATVQHGALELHVREVGATWGAKCKRETEVLLSTRPTRNDACHASRGRNSHPGPAGKVLL